MEAARNLKFNPDPEPQRVALDEIASEPVKQDVSFDALAKSIQQLGILQPPILKEPKTKKGKYEIIAGRRRIAVAQKLGIDPIWCAVYPKTTDAAFIPTATIAENRVRSNNIGADIVAIGLMIEQGYDDPEVVSYMTGLPLKDAKELLSLRDLPSQVLDGIVGGDIATTTAKEVKKLRKGAMDRALAILDETGKLTANDVRKVREVQIDQAAAQVVLPVIPDIPEIEDDLITAKGDTLGVLDGVIAILQSEGTDSEKISRLRSLVGLVEAIPHGDEASGASAKGSADQADASGATGTIAQRTRRRKESRPDPSDRPSVTG